MSKGLLDPKVDFVFKNIFGSPNHPEILISFLNATLKAKKKIVNVHIKKTDIEKQYIEDKYSFMDYQCRDSSRDIVIYTISDKNLNIWLQEDYSFTINFLTKAENVDYDIFQLLNDEYFGYSFTNISESILYDKKQNKTV